MKNLILTLATLCFSVSVSAQSSTKNSPNEVRVYFNKSKGTISQKLNEYFEDTITVIAPAQKVGKGVSVELVIQNSDISIPKKDIKLPSNIKIEIDEEKDVTNKFIIVAKSNSDDDRIIKLGIVARDSCGNTLKLRKGETTKTILIKNNPALSKSWNNEFWLFTGTNLDLLDGPKAKDLYFMGSYLQNLSVKNKRSPHWFYISFGKNRYFSDVDSTASLRYSNILKNISRDSFQVERGTYRTDLVTKNENLYIELKYLRELNFLATAESRFFITGGLNFSLQNFEENYSNNSFLRRDTLIMKLSPSNFGNPITNSKTSREFNTNSSIGLMHILATDKINVKTMIMVGNNRWYLPTTNSSNTRTNMESSDKTDNLFFKTRIDATILKPGLSLGFEIFTRVGRAPQFNVSLSKVIDLQNLGQLFGKVTQAKI